MANKHVLNKDLPNQLRLRATTNTPNVADVGTIRYADGTTWDPGSGQGYYYWDGAAWVPLGYSGSGATTFIALTDTPSSYSGAGSKVVAVNSGATALEFVASSSATPVQVDEYTTTGADSWTKPAGAVAVRIELVGAGAGGCSGARGAAGTFRPGGPGGGGGAYYCATYLASELDATLTLEIGAGGAGGASRSTDDTQGANGVDGGDTYAYDTSTWASAYGGKTAIAPAIGSSAAGGDGGQSGLGDTSNFADYYATFNRHTNPIAVPITFGPFGGPGIDANFGASADLGGGGGGGVSNNGQLEINNGASLANAGWAGGGSMHGGGGGGGGGSLSTSNTKQRGANAGKHGWMMHQLLTGTTAGAGAAGATGATTNEYPLSISDGGGGGGANTGAAAGAGGAAGRGGGGGGGGASENGYASGAGGAGGNGYIRITTFF